MLSDCLFLPLSFQLTFGTFWTEPLVFSVCWHLSLSACFHGSGMNALLVLNGNLEMLLLYNNTCSPFAFMNSHIREPAPCWEFLPENRSLDNHISKNLHKIKGRGSFFEKQHRNWRTKENNWRREGCEGNFPWYYHSMLRLLLDHIFLQIFLQIILAIKRLLRI